MSTEPDQQIPQDRGPLLRVVRGNPTDAELAALTVVLAAASAAGSAEEAEQRPPNRWNDPVARLRRPLPPVGPDAWRATYWPR